jgi:hypothetical protein
VLQSLLGHLRQHLLVRANGTVAAYVRLGALQAILEYQRANPEPEPPKKQSTIEELEGFLREQCGQQHDGTHRRNAFDQLDEI